MSRPLTIAFATLSLALLVACGGPTNSTTQPAGAAGSAPSGSPQALTVQGTDTFKFQPESLTVKAGQPVKLTLTNVGQTVHDWSLTQGVAQPVKIEAAGGQSASATFTIERPGSYTFICSQPGHEAAGMKGTIVAQ